MCCNCGTVTVFCTLTPSLSLNTTGMSTTWPEEKRTATVGSRLSPTLSAHRGPAQQTSITLSMYCNCRISGKTNHGNLRLRHDRDVYDLDMHNNGHVNPVHNAQFETVRTCLCCITAIPTNLSRNCKAPSTVRRRLLEYVTAWPQRRDQPEHPGQALTRLIAEDMRVRAKQHPLSRRKPHPHIVLLSNEETLQLSRRRGWADTGGHPRTRVRAHLRTFFAGEKMC